MTPSSKDHGAGDRTPAIVWVLLAVLTLMAGALRFAGIERQLPYSPEPDDYLVVQLVQLEAGVPVEERMNKFRSYPLLLASLARLVPAVASAAPDAPLDAQLRAAAEPTLRMRWLIAVLATLGVPLLFAVARAFFDPWPALLAAGWFATSFNHLMFSQQARPHAAHATLVLLAFVAALALVRRPGLVRSLALGGACALACATLQTGAFTLLPLVAAHVLSRSTTDPAWRRKRWWGLLLALVVAVGLAALFVPAEQKQESSVSLQELAAEDTQVRQDGHRFELAKLNGQGFKRGFRQVFLHDPVLLVAGCLGLFLLLPRWRSGVRDPRVLVLAAHAVPYGLLWGMYAWVYDRYWLPLYPELALLATAFAVWIAKRAARREVVLAIVAVLLLAFPIVVVARFTVLARRPDTVREATDWLTRAAGGAPATVLVTPQLNLPVVYSVVPDDVVPDWKRAQAWLLRQRQIPPAASVGPRLAVRNLPLEATSSDAATAQAIVEQLFAELRPRYVVIEATRWNRWITLSSVLWGAAVARGEPVFASAGEEDGMRSSFYQNIPAPIPRLFALDRLGPRIEVYELR